MARSQYALSASDSNPRRRHAKPSRPCPLDLLKKRNGLSGAWVGLWRSTSNIQNEPNAVFRKSCPPPPRPCPFRSAATGMAPSRSGAVLPKLSPDGRCRPPSAPQWLGSAASLCSTSALPGPVFVFQSCFSIPSSALTGGAGLRVGWYPSPHPPYQDPPPRLRVNNEEPPTWALAAPGTYSLASVDWGTESPLPISRHFRPFPAF